MGLPGDPGGDVAWMTLASPPAALSLSQPGPPELAVYSVFTGKQSKTYANREPTPPYTAPALLGHLVTTSLAKSLAGVPRAARGRRRTLNPQRAQSRQGGRRPGTPRQAGSAGLSRPRQRRQKAPSGGYRESLG